MTASQSGAIAPYTRDFQVATKSVRDTFASYGSSVIQRLSHVPHYQHVVFPEYF